MKSRTTIMKLLNKLLATLAIALMATSARAIPTLQLDILGGTYDTSSETVIAPANTFALYAYGLNIDLADKFFISMAVVPSTTTPGSYGSFTVNGTTVNVTSDMTAGGPPLESSGVIDPGDLAKHGVFPTYFAEQGFYFSLANQSLQYNTQDNAGSGPQPGTGMYFKEFDLDISNLAPGLGIHFDLYNEALITKCKNKTCTTSDIDINQFAPFSHDAEGMVTAIPEPETYALLLAGLGLMGVMARRRKQKVSA
jgi:hypothetical protein